MIGVLAAITAVKLLCSDAASFCVGSSEGAHVLSYRWDEPAPELQAFSANGIMLTPNSEMNFLGERASESRSVPTAPALFRMLVEQWHAERGATSSISEMAMCRSYLRIMSMSGEAVPLILRTMEQEGEGPDMWFVALQAITGVDPVTDDTRGDFKAMADLWLAWGRANGYVW